MPKLSIDYSKCCIYKIEHIDDESLVYVGHTTNFKLRKQRHKVSCNNETDKSKHNYTVHQMIRNNGRWDLFRMIEIEKYPCNNKQEADKREFEIIKKMNARMNTHIFLKNEDQKSIQKKRYEEYRLNKKLYDECMRELDFMT